MNSTSRIRISALGIALSVSGAGIAMAQTEAADSDGASVELENIVVTAQRRSETAQKVPASIVALSGDDLIKAGIASAADMAKVVPNLNTYSPLGEGSSPVFVMRGITANDYSPSQSHPVALYIDDGIRGSSALEVVQLYDIERVEALRGPQGTLYGKNATGGAINIITRKPSFKDEGYFTVGYGSFNRVEARGAVETTVVDGVLAARLATQYVKDDGLIKNVLAGQPRKDQTDTLGVRLSMAFTPFDAFDATLRVFHSRVGGQGPGLFAKDVRPYLGTSRADLGFYESRTNYNPERRIRDSGVNLTMNYQLSDTYTLTSVTTYDDAEQLDPGDYDGLEVHSDHITIGAGDISQFMQEIRLNADYGKLSLLGGLFYNSDSMYVTNQYTFLGEARFGIVFDPNAFGVPYAGPTLYGFNEQNAFDQERNSYSGYLRADYEITDNVKVFGGFRYSRDRVEALNYSASIGGNIDTGLAVDTEADWRFPVPTFTDVDRRKTFNNNTFEAGAEYQLGSDALVYGSFKQGYRTGAISAQAFLTTAEITIVKPETVDAYELGFKYQLPSQHLTFNLAVFRNDYRNQQFLNTEGALIILRNADKSRISGVEAELRLRPLDRLALTAGVGWLDPEFVRATITPNNPPAGDISGNQLIGANKLSGSLGLDWDVMRTQSGDLNLRLDGSYRSRTYYQATNPKDLSQGGYWLANARLSYDMDRLSIALWGKNMLGKEYFVSSFAFADAVGVNEFNRGARRQFGAEATISF